MDGIIGHLKCAGVPEVMRKPLRTVLDYVWDEAKRSHDALPVGSRGDHVFQRLLFLRFWLDNSPREADREIDKPTPDLHLRGFPRSGNLETAAGVREFSDGFPRP